MPTPINPYIAGNPVGGGTAFIGRADVLREVLRVLRHPHQNALVLYGQRRIGKTSVLQELAARLPNEGPYHPVFFDLQDKAALPLARVLVELAARIAEKLALPPPPAWGDDASRAFRADFIPQVLAHLPAETSLALLFDEFDVLDNPGEGQAGAAFFPYLRDLLSLNPRLQFIFVIGRRPEELSSFTLSVFKGVKSYPVSLMSAEDTASLVRLAEGNNTLRWPDEAVGHVYSLTGGHPFLTQQLCQQIWEQAYEAEPDEPPVIQPAAVEAAVPVALREATNALEWLWDGLKPAERVVASALAGAGPQAISQEELNQRLLDSGVRILIGELQDAPRALQQWDLIEPIDGGYRFRVEMLRRWLAERKPLTRVQEEIDRIQPVADNLFQAAYNLYQSGQLDQAIPLLRQAIGFNPNHLRANQILAEILLAQGELTEARQILETLYQYQQAAARPRLVQTILRQAQEAKNDEERLALYERVLQLEPTQPEATEGRRSLWQKWGDEALVADDLEAAMDAYRRAALPQKIITVGLQQIRKLDEQGKYQAALDLARQLHAEFPEERDGLPDLALLERKTRLNDLYQRALGALQADDRETAQKLLIEVVSLEPGYQQGKATRDLLLAVTGDDIDRLQAQLANENKLKRQAEAKTKKEAEARQKREAEVTQLQNQLKTEQQLRQKAEAALQKKVEFRQWSEEEIKATLATFDTITKKSPTTPKTQTENTEIKEIAPQRSQTPTEGTTIQKTDAVPEKKPSWRPWDKWLIGTLTWLPFLLPNLALGLAILTPAGNVWPVQTYLWISGVTLLVWLSTISTRSGLDLNNEDDAEGAKAVALALVGLFAAVLVWGDSGILSAIGAFVIVGVAVAPIGFLTYWLGMIIAEMLPIVGRGVVTIILVIFTGFIMARGISGNLVGFLIDLAKFVAIINLTLVFAYWLVRGLREAKDNANHPRWITRAIYGGLVAAFGFVIWYTFLGGQAFL